MKVVARLLAAAAFIAIATATAAIVLPALRADQPPEATVAAEPTATLDALDATGAKLPGESAAATLGVSAAAPRQTTLIPASGFDVNAVMADIRALEAFGPRAGGSEAEASAARYIRDRLVAMGLDAQIEEFPLPSGAVSRNVVARVKGSSEKLVVLGAHMDTKPPSPGANDNASGCAALLEIAGELAKSPAVPTVEFVFYGSEEIGGKKPSEHHFGSRYRLGHMSEAERAQTAGMISVDMIGYGSGFHSRTMGKGPLTLSDRLLAHAKALGINMTYLRDPGASGWSDHEAYELAGIPVSWVEWRDDPVYHTEGDTASHLQTARIATAGKLVLSFVRNLDETTLTALTTR